MQKESIRMYAYAIDFHRIDVYLSKKYYDGISSKFYLKNLKTNTLTLLNGDLIKEKDGFNCYRFQASFRLGDSYRIVDAYGLTCYLDYSLISQCAEFDDLYYYAGDDLGSTYSKESTTFKVWSPLSTSVVCRVFHQNEIAIYPMTRGIKGVYEISVEGDLDGYEYVYDISMNDQIFETTDPYAYASTSNQRSSVIINIDKTYVDDFNVTPLLKKTDAIIYETSVRDFSMHEHGNMEHKGQFLAFCEKDTRSDVGYSTGLDYLELLGITHIQLMPINDFATVDEDNPRELYNWGYDPAQYNVTEGSYVTDPNDGYKRIIECKKMIASIHARNMRVILDVVYNHMHDVNFNSLEKTVPYYFFRRDEQGQLSNGSWCGNDLNTKAKMCRKYILDMCARWQKFYGADGFRFDLMGIIDKETMLAIEKQGRLLNPSFMVYGEGWNMNTAINEDERTIIDLNRDVPSIGFFNDYFRDTMRGTNQLESKGYMSGDTYKTNDAIVNLCNYDKFENISQSINYVECHDNATTYDKLKISNYDEDKTILRKRALMALGSVIVAQGIPFIHSGQEFFRSKKGQSNTYNAGDMINCLDWERRDREIQAVEFTKFLIHLRKNNPCFRYDQYEDMRNHIEIKNIDHQMIQYHLTQDEGQYKEFQIFFNPSLNSVEVPMNNDYTILYHMENEEINDDILKVEGVSLVILAR